MKFVILINLLAVYFTYLESRRQMKNGMLIGFILITVIACLHYDFGSDYMDYYALYKHVEDSSWREVFDVEFYRDPGWTLLNWCFQRLGGFFSMVAVLNLIQNIAYYFFIRRYSVPENRTFSVFLYLFLTNYYMMNFSMMRQGFVIAIFAAMWPLIENRKWWISIGIIFLLTFIHNSAILLYPFAFWGFIPVKKTSPYAIGGLILLFSLYTSQELLSDIFNRMMLLEDFKNYSFVYDQGKQSKFGIGAFIQLFPFVISAWSLTQNNDYSESQKRMIILSTLGFLAAPFASIIFMVGRAGWYFSVYSLVAVPLVFKSIKNSSLSTAITALYIFITVYNVFVYYGPTDWNMETYHTIFEAIW